MVRTGNLFPARLRAEHQDKHQNTTYRRNGKLQACEPCRKGKSRCDHMKPHCGRCSRRGKTEQCVYHPAPLTKAATASISPAPKTGQSSPNQTAQSALQRDDLEHMPALSPGFRQPTSPMQPLRHTSSSIPSAFTNSIDDLPRLKRFRPNNFSESMFPSPVIGQQEMDLCKPLPGHQVSVDAQGFDMKAGITNHSAVLTENESSIGILPPLIDSSPSSKISQSNIDRGASVLTLFKDLPTIRKYIDKWFSFAGGVVVIEPMVKIYLDGLWSTWHKTLELQKVGDLRVMSEKIWENTSKPVSRLLKRDTTPRDFCANVTGANLRWEVVGILVTLVSLLAQTLKDGDPIFCTHDEPPVDRAELALKMHNASEMCVNFCDDSGVLNDLYLWLLYENSIAYCSLRTRGSYENWKKTSALTAALMCCNLHQEIKVDDNTPFFMAELRKRLFVCAYHSDKTLATFSGRPPKLTRHYCRLQIPLDLTDAQTMSEGSEIEIAIDDLDREGWNQQGAVQRSTFARLSATNALITEEILEISFGKFPHDEVVRRAAEIEMRAHRCWDELPDFLRINIDSIWDSKRSPLELFFLLYIRLTNLDHHFLLQRTLSKKAGSGPADSNTNLLSVCDELFKFVIVMVDHRDHFRDFQIDLVQILTVHGIPAAAVLAVELLHQEQDPTSMSAMAYPLNRSDTIQHLSVFVSCLGTIRPDANGFQSCDRGKKFLKKILDTILGSGPTVRRDSPLDFDQVGDPTLSAAFVPAGSAVDFGEWLENMEWDQENWINFH